MAAWQPSSNFPGGPDVPRNGLQHAGREGAEEVGTGNGIFVAGYRMAMSATAYAPGFVGITNSTAT
jgi:hypothetical protein